MWLVLLALLGGVSSSTALPEAERATRDLFAWQACEDPTLWERSPVWGPGNPRFSAAAETKTEGNGAVRVDYTTKTGDTAIGISPHLDGPANLEAFGAFSLDIYNPDPWRKRIRTVFVGSNGERLRLECRLKGGSGGHEGTLPAGPGWSTPRFVFDPAEVEEIGPEPMKEALRSVAGIAIVLGDDNNDTGAPRDGYVLVDNLQLWTLPPGAGKPRYPFCLPQDDPRAADGDRLLSSVRARFARGDFQGNWPDLQQLLEVSPNLDAAGIYLQDLYRRATPALRQQILHHLKAKAAGCREADPEKAEGYGRLARGLQRQRTDGRPQVVAESAREIPVFATVDVVVAGGNSAAVAAAEAAARAGARVFLATEQPYLGHDLAGTLRLWLANGPLPHPDLATRLFYDLPKAPTAALAPAPEGGQAGTTAPPSAVPLTPLKAKQTLDAALQSAGVEFLYGCYATDLVVDKSGKPAGIVIANRSGRQAVLARVVIDATDRATLARAAGAQCMPFRAGAQTARWTTINAAPPRGVASTVTALPFAADLYDKHGRQKDVRRSAAWYEHAVTADLPDSTWAARARLEQSVRDAAYCRGQLYAADTPFIPSPVTVRGATSWAKPWPGAGALDLGVFRPKGVERVWLLSACADVPAAQAENLLHPVAYCEIGARVGLAAAAEARALPAPVPAGLAGRSAPATVPGEVRELLAGLRPAERLTVVRQAARLLPVLGEYDVVVVGGGTAGAPAGIGAARQGAKTLVLEYLHGLGGVGTYGMIGAYWYGNRVGFTSTVPAGPTEVRMEWYRRELRRAGADIWFGVTGCGVLARGSRVTGVVVATPQGRGVVLAKTVIDATGNAEIAQAAGAPCAYVDDTLTVQASHFPPRKVGAWYINGDIGAVDVSDPIQTREVLLSRSKLAGSFDSGPMVAARERQRVVGDFTLDWLDIINERTFPDSIVLSRSDYDSHGVQVHPFFALRPARPVGAYAHQFEGYMPYRCLLPKETEGMLVVGLGVSAHRDALPIIRMQPDLHNHGYAAGAAAAMAVTAGVTPRRVDVRKLQRHLVEIGNLPESVLTDTDSFPLPAERVAEAIRKVKEDFAGLDVLMAAPAQALPLLRQALREATGEDAIHYAEVLGVMGDPAGVPALIAEAERRLQSPDLLAPEKMQPDEVARVIWALGYAGDHQAVPVLCRLAEAIGPRDVGRFRALVLSLGRLGDPAAAPALARMADLQAKKPGRREMLAAVALYRCGDPTGAAKALLKRATQSTDGITARLAIQVLQVPAGKKP